MVFTSEHHEHLSWGRDQAAVIQSVWEPEGNGVCVGAGVGLVVASGCGDTGGTGAEASFLTLARLRLPAQS